MSGRAQSDDWTRLRHAAAPQAAAVEVQEQEKGVRLREHDWLSRRDSTDHAQLTQAAATITTTAAAGGWPRPHSPQSKPATSMSSVQ
jgi:hypothetical protein